MAYKLNVDIEYSVNLRETLAIGHQFAKFGHVFYHQQFPLYSTENTFMVSYTLHYISHVCP